MPKKIKKPFICKFQRPISTTGSISEILVYNEDRSLEVMMELNDDEIEALFPEMEYKTYWKCIVKNKMLNPIEQVEEQEW